MLNFRRALTVLIVLLAGACTQPQQNRTEFSKAPAAPTSLTAIGKTNAIQLDWAPVETARDYIVFRSETSGSGYAEIATTATPAYEDNGLTAGVTYYYVVAARNRAGVSGNSAEASATALKSIAAPTGLQASAGDRRVALNWNPVAGAVSYQIGRGTKLGGPYSSMVEVASTSYVDTTVRNRLDYYYTVQAIGDDGNVSPTSEEARAFAYRYGGEVCVAAENAASISVLPADATGDVTPSRTLEGRQFFTGNLDPSGLAYDPESNLLFVSDRATSKVINAYELNNKDRPFTQPLFQITQFEVPSQDQLTFPVAIVLAEDVGELYVVDQDKRRIHVFPTDASGEANAPIFWKANPFDPIAVAYSPLHQEVFVLNKDGQNGRIEVFDRSAPLSGVQVPIRSIGGTLSGISYRAKIIYNPFEDTLIVANYSKSNVLTFKRTDDGDVAPIRSFDASSPSSVALSRDGEELFVLEKNAIQAYPVTATGKPAPLRRLSGLNTGLTMPLDIIALSDRDEIAALDRTGIRFFSTQANGNVAPLRIIGNSINGILRPKAVAADLDRNELHVLDSERALTFPLEASGTTAPLRAIGRWIKDIDVHPFGLLTLSSSQLSLYAAGATGSTPAVIEADSNISAHNQVVYDPVAHEVWVADEVGLTVFDPDTLVEKRSVYFDDDFELWFDYFAVDGEDGHVYAFSSWEPAIHVFDSALTSLEPVRTIVWPEEIEEDEEEEIEQHEHYEKATEKAGLMYDPINRELYAALNGNLYVLASEAEGLVNPLRKLSLRHLGINENNGIAMCR